MMRRLASVASKHDHDLCAALTDEERDQLAALLSRVAAHQGLEPGVHPGYRRLGPTPAGQDPPRHGGRVRAADED